MLRICLVTEELAGVQGSGGIGAAFDELGILLANHGNMVDILYCPVEPFSQEDHKKVSDRLMAHGIRLDLLKPENHVHPPYSYEKKSYSIYEYLKNKKAKYDFIHFHDYKGLGFFPISAKRQGLFFKDTCMVVQVHGPTRWAIEANHAFFIHEDQLKIDFMEKQSIARADQVVSPSQYLIDWMINRGFKLPGHGNVHVIKNICTNLYRRLCPYLDANEDSGQLTENINEIILFARHEERKGFTVFCDAINRLADILHDRNILVTFIGKLGHLASQNSGIYLIDSSKNWKFPVNIFTEFDRDRAAKYLTSNRRSMVVIPSPIENSPYTVFETIVLKKPLITSCKGGAPELIANDYHTACLCQIEAGTLADHIKRFVIEGAPVAKLTETLQQIEEKWLSFHNSQLVNLAGPNGTLIHHIKRHEPKVVFGIVHYERPNKLVDAVTSAIRQTYENIEIIVVDDGSKSQRTLESLSYIESMLKRVNGKLIRQENKYLGAARNAILQNSDSEYIVFLDDDDVAFPTLVETLVKAIENSGADAVNCFNLYLESAHREFGVSSPEFYTNKVSYIPIGGPLSIAASENVFGAATALFRRSALEKIGGYTELYGVGHEDYELFLRLAQSGAKLEVCPEKLYLYEVGRPSMLTKTSLARNFYRCFIALEADKNSQEWHDLINLHIGKKVSENSHNKAWWLNSINTNPDLRLQIFNSETSKENKIGLLAELADREGNIAIREAFRRDMEEYKQSHKYRDEDCFLLLNNNKNDEAYEPHQGFDHELDEIKFDLALKRQSDALAKLKALICERAVLTDELLTLVRSCTAQKLNEDDMAEARSLGNILIKQRFASKNKTLAVLKLVSFFASTGDFDTIKGFCSEIMNDDETNYLLAHADVAEAIKQGKEVSGLSHYSKYGRHEQRNGFAHTRLIADEIGRTIGKTINIWELFDFLSLVTLRGQESCFSGNGGASKDPT